MLLRARACRCRRSAGRRRADTTAARVGVVDADVETSGRVERECKVLFASRLAEVREQVRAARAARARGVEHVEGRVQHGFRVLFGMDAQVEVPLLTLEDVDGEEPVVAGHAEVAAAAEAADAVGQPRGVDLDVGCALQQHRHVLVAAAIDRDPRARVAGVGHRCVGHGRVDVTGIDHAAVALERSEEIGIGQAARHREKDESHVPHQNVPRAPRTA